MCEPSAGLKIFPQSLHFTFEQHIRTSKKLNERTIVPTKREHQPFYLEGWCLCCYIYSKYLQYKNQPSKLKKAEQQELVAEKENLFCSVFLRIVRL